MSFVHQILIDRAFGVNRDELLPLPSRQKRNDCELRASGLDLNHWPDLHLERHIHPIVLGVILRRILLNAAGEPVLADEHSLHQCRRGADPLGSIGSSRFEQSSG